MRKIVSVLLASCILFSSTGVSNFAQDIENTTIDNLQKLADQNSEVLDNIKRYKPLTVGNREIRLYPESTMTAEEAMLAFKNAYDLIAKNAEQMQLTISLDAVEFQEYVKTFAFYESGNPELDQEIESLVKFVDFYENASKNQVLLKEVAESGTDSNDEMDLEALMPINSISTIASGEITEKAPTASNESTSYYDVEAVVAYASSWWDKTNNSDYPYYAEYEGQDPSSNSYNRLDDGRPGQSNPARGWNDCASYVSQCLAAGGVPQIKEGILFPHRNPDNWYYNDSKPSHTWGGAPNFYEHWKKRVGIADSSDRLGAGDAVSIDFEEDGDIDHTVIIVADGSGDSSKLLSAHTIDRFETSYRNGVYEDWSLKSLYDMGCKIYGFEIDSVF